ncbi:hypothetical protein [Streptomyces liangshanensis]|uniref:Uncharacterized protein n=1 Tax=Streptomyces liangshanensis TaxID=2717324 RepID=A0A6G9H1E0_9ACTN|nr:hypothetical protein [Streptomyces liangshanensis]QIQ04325.1 hypothetical protein HA039_20270 [Streptomyces liangshanensis]
MSRDDDLTARAAEPDFWPLYLFDDHAMEAYEEARENEEEEGEEAEDEVLRAAFWLDHDLGLELEFEPGVAYVNLAVRSPRTAEAETVGWDDLAHFHPHVMPWSELDLLCRAAALHNPALRHPGPMLALLLRFAFLTENENLDAVTPLANAAFAAVRPAATDKPAAPGALAAIRSETRDWFDLRDLRSTGIEWRTRPDGHRAVTQHDRDGLPLYSLREPESKEFPFAAWSALLARATDRLTSIRTNPALHTPDVQSSLNLCTQPNGHHHLAPLASALSRAGFDHPTLLRALSQPIASAEAAWAVETLAGLEQGELIATWHGPSPLAGSSSWRLTLTLPAAGHPWRFAQDFAAELSTALQTADLGRAETGGSTSVKNEHGSYVHHSDRLDVLIRDDLPAGVQLISQLLHHHQAAKSATLKHTEPPYTPIPLPTPTP